MGLSAVFCFKAWSFIHSGFEATLPNILLYSLAWKFNRYLSNFEISGTNKISALVTDLYFPFGPSIYYRNPKTIDSFLIPRNILIALFDNEQVWGARGSVICSRHCTSSWKVAC
jgi:hypothetical protein